MLTALFLAARLEGISPFPYVRALIRSGLPLAASRLQFLSPALATQLLDMDLSRVDFTDRFLLSSWGTLATRMRPLLTETLVQSLSGSDFTAGELMRARQPVTVYLRWPERDLPALSPLVRLLWGSLIDGLITTYDTAKGQHCGPVLLLIDEAGRTAIPSLADHATTVVGRGISLWVAIQSLSQLDAVYGRARAQVIRDNMESQLYYRPADQQTADYLEHCLGRRSAYAHSQTTHGGSQTSEAASEQAVPLLSAQEIKQMADTAVIGFHRNLPPFQARRMDWRDFPELSRRRQIRAPGLSPLPPISPDRTGTTPVGKAESAPVWKVDPDLLSSPGPLKRGGGLPKKRAA